MLKFPSSRKFALALCAGVAVFAIGAAPVYAQHVGGSARGGGGAVGHAGGYGGYRGGYGGYRGGYGGYRGGYGGYRGYGGWGYRGGYWGGWGWGGLGLGLYFATLPYYYSTYWWGGVPYYYADSNYYQWDGSAGQYVTVAPPAGLAEQQGGAQGGTAGGAANLQDLMVYPKGGQSEEQTKKDKYECHKWASGQTGFDPTQAGGSAPNRRSDYVRAQMACLEGRGYSVK